MLPYRIEKQERISTHSSCLTGKARDSSLLPRQVRTSDKPLHHYSPLHLPIVSTFLYHLEISAPPWSTNIHTVDTHEPDSGLVH